MQRVLSRNFVRLHDAGRGGRKAVGAPRWAGGGGGGSEAGMGLDGTVSGVVSRKVLPACGGLCCLCPSLRPRSRQPVKRYKKILIDIFPAEQVSQVPFLPHVRLCQLSVLLFSLLAISCIFVGFYPLRAGIFMSIYIDTGALPVMR
jgi:hypothetical protein